jgi:hypothetical protein
MWRWGGMCVGMRGGVFKYRSISEWTIQELGTTTREIRILQCVVSALRNFSRARHRPLLPSSSEFKSHHRMKVKQHFGCIVSSLPDLFVC